MIVTTIPTIGFAVETVVDGSATFTSFELAAAAKVHALHQDFVADADALVFVVDASDVDRLTDVEHELVDLMTRDQLRDVKLLVFANQQDRPCAINAVALRTRLESRLDVKQPMRVQDTVILTGEGVTERFEWLVRVISTPETLQT
ncbi:hypothetical protein HK405_006397 [Cladochytrium tenue]|nr:hypothetical protein HK405_006397 [Cladochytrium tenue]